MGDFILLQEKSILVQSLGWQWEWSSFTHPEHNKKGKHSKHMLEMLKNDSHMSHQKIITQYLQINNLTNVVSDL